MCVVLLRCVLIPHTFGWVWQVAVIRWPPTGSGYTTMAYCGVRPWRDAGLSCPRCIVCVAGYNNQTASDWQWLHNYGMLLRATDALAKRSFLPSSIFHTCSKEQSFKYSARNPLVHVCVCCSFFYYVTTAVDQGFLTIQIVLFSDKLAKDHKATDKPKQAWYM